MPTVLLTRSKHLFPFAAVLRQHGEPVGRLLRQAGLPSTCLDDPNALIPVAREGRFRELAAHKSGCSNLALTAVQPLGLEDLGEFGQALLSEPTLQRSLSQLSRLIATETSNLAFELRPQPGGDLLFAHRFRTEDDPGQWHNALYVLAWMLKVVQRVNPSWCPAEILIRATVTPTRAGAIETLGAAPRFEQTSTGFLVPAPMLALPLAKIPTVEHGREVPDDPLWSTAPAKTYAGAVQQMIRSYASDGWLSVEQASEVAKTSVRTLQRRLSAEQTTYSTVVEDTRAEMAGELLERTDATIAEIAYRLGYEYQGDFTRAFCRWAGAPPSEFRRQRRHN